MYSQYVAGNYSPMLEKVRKEWQSYTGKIFEDIVRELMVEKMISDYPDIGSWWNRKGDEIDILGVNRQGRKVLAIEVKNKELGESEAREILELTLDKAKLVRGISGQELKVGIVARKVKGRKHLEDDGFLVWELEELIP
jgi:AAA+ ATPase superfamily predicted ATPase